MNSYVLSSATHDLDGLSFPTNQAEVLQAKRNYALNQAFGFDPSLIEQNMFGQYSGNSNKPANWNGFGNCNMSHQNSQHVLAQKYSSAHRHSLSLPQLQQHNGTIPQPFTNPGIGSPPGGALSLDTKNLHNASRTSLYGQVTPPRSSSATSEPSKNGRDPTSAISEQPTTKRRRGKAQGREPLTPSDDNKRPK